MQAVNADADARMPEPSQEHSGISEGLRRHHLSNGVLEKFAQNMTENIMSIISQVEMMEQEVDRFNENQEKLAEGLASAVMEDALREVCGGQTIENHAEGFQSSRSIGVKMDGAQLTNLPFTDQSESERDFLDTDAEMDPGKENQISGDIQPCHAPLPQSGLPVLGSLDYPDPPPTTPLLPELERSRSSFARKLKGGLAKVFLPSPPPPTPKDEKDASDGAANDPRVELMEHLMQSLPTDDLKGDYFEVGLHHETKMEAFAEALSFDIIGRVLSAKNREQLADDSNLHQLANQLAETIISSSLDEAKMLF